MGEGGVISAIRPSRRLRPGTRLSGVSCGRVITVLAFFPSDPPLPEAVAESIGLLHHVRRCGRCDPAWLFAALLEERSN